MMDIGVLALNTFFRRDASIGYSPVMCGTAGSCDSSYLDLNGVYGYVTPKLAQWPTVL
jgi:hypothetical protein